MSDARGGMDIEDVANLTGDPIVNEAHKRLTSAMEWYGDAHRKFVEDLKFRNADSENGWQWPNNVRASRDIDSRPCLTLNITRQHNLMIVNQARQARTDVNILGTGGGASAESAAAFKWIIRYIEYQSNAWFEAYKMANHYQVDGGFGWWRIVTDWASPDVWEQEIYIRPVWDPLSVVIDPDARMLTREDARWAIVFDSLPREEFNDAYPDLKMDVGSNVLGVEGESGQWMPKDHMLVAEYFKKVPREDLLVNFMWQGQRHNIRRSEMPDNVAEVVLNDKLTRTRPVIEDEIEWYLMAGSKRVNEARWLGKYIPLIPVFGEQSIVEGQYDCKGHTRSMKDAQRMFNYNASAQVEYGALQTKIPWVIPIEGIEQYGTFWATANTINHSYLPYKSFNADNPERPIPPPFRPDPPQPSPAYQQGMNDAFSWMMMTTGQWQNQMGMMGNERTGEAIQQRQSQSDTATFHFQDNFGAALQFGARQLIDLIPKIYITKQVKRILTDEGLEFDLVIDPGQREAYVQQLGHDNEVISRVFNPSVGKYDVAADVGASIATKREQNREALTLILTQAPALTGVIGDLLMKNMDFDDGQEAARRLRRMVPPQALGVGPTQQEQLLQQQVQQLQGLLSKAMQRAGMDRAKAADRTARDQVDVYRAETDRVQALAQLLPEDAEGLKSLIEQLVQDSLATHILPMLGTPSAPEGDAGYQGVGVQGAQQAPDGEWYLRDPTKMRGYLKITPLAQEHKVPQI